MHRIVLLLLLLPTPLAFAQSDAEKFAEGRIALDKHNDCPAARAALESVSEKGRSEPLWLFYTAKTYECLNQPDKALPLYEKYNQLMPGQTGIIDKIGELRYQVRHQQKEKDAEEARQQKLEEDRQERERKRQSAQSMLPDLLRALQAEPLLNTSWTGESGRQWSVKVAGEPSCQFGIAVNWNDPDRYQDPGTKWERIFIVGSTRKLVLDLTKVAETRSSKTCQGVGSPSCLDFSGYSPATGRLDIVNGSVQKIDKVVAKSRKDPLWGRDDSSNDSTSDSGFILAIAPPATDADLARLKKSFEGVIQACHDAQ